MRSSILARDYYELERENRELREELTRLRDQCTFQCNQLRIEQLVAKFQIPSFLLETNYVKKLIAEANFEKLEQVLADRHRLFYGKCKVVEGKSEEL